MEISGRIVLGIILVGLGLMIFLGTFGIDSGDFTLLIIGGAFLVAYFQSSREQEHGRVGLLIPGAIILMVGLYTILENNIYLGELEGPLFFFLLGTAFWLVYLIHSMHFQQKWAAITGGSIYLFGIFVLIIEYWGQAGKYLKYFWGFALLALGVWIIFRTFKQQRK